MSTPVATQQTSDKPSKNAVTKAVDPKQKADDVDRKMKLFGVIQAFREYRFPDNKQIDDALKYTLEKSPVDVEKLSPDGQRLIADVRQIIETARQMVLQKNSQEEFQKFLFASRKADVASQVGVKSPVSKDNANKDAETAGEALRTLLKLFLRNGEIRKLFSDFALIGRDVFADAAIRAAEVSRPNEEKLAQVDKPAPDNEFHDDIPQALKKADKPLEVAGKTQEDVEKVIDPNATAQENATKVAGAIKDNTFGKLSDENKAKFNEQRQKAENYFKEKFPKERREQFIYRLKKVVVECQRHREYQDAIEFFLTAFEHYHGHAQTVAKQVEDSAKNARGEGNVQTAEQSFRTLIERFANGRSTQPMISAIDVLYNDVKQDSELKAWFQRLDKYLRACLQTPGYIMKDDADREARAIFESGKKFFVAAEGREQGKYAPHKDKLFDEVDHFFKGMAEDPLNKQFGDDWHRLVQDIFLNAEGKATFKRHLWHDVRDPIAPQLLTHVGWVPIPRIEYADKDVDVVIENILLDPVNLLPNKFEAEVFNRFEMSQFGEDKHHHQLKLALRGMQTDMRGINFDIRKKTGLKLKDSGSADVLVAGKGLDVYVHLEASSLGKNQRRKNVFSVKSVKVDIGTLNFAIRHSKSSTLVKILKPLATGLIKKQIKKAIEAAIKDGLQKADEQLLDLFNSLEDAKKNPDAKQMDVLKEKFSSAQSTAEEKKPAGTVKLATSKRDSILPNMGRTDGWVNRIDERSDAAKAQQSNTPDWHSPAFSIVAPGQAEPTNVGVLPPPKDFKNTPNGSAALSTSGNLSGPQTNVTTATGNQPNGVVA